ncbi:MAG: proline dehydrogenase family protein, partial [Planctomycetes bacterium]|nr:proline dehydrogenase family protein [Planctomycetota bacterium]
AALKRAAKKRNAAYRYSFDMLGEAALTAADAERYFLAYQDAIQCIGTDPSDTTWDGRYVDADGEATMSPTWRTAAIRGMPPIYFMHPRCWPPGQ